MITQVTLLGIGTTLISENNNETFELEEDHSEMTTENIFKKKFVNLNNFYINFHPFDPLDFSKKVQ